MTHVLALEAADGARTIFHSPLPWVRGSMTPTFNGRTCTEAFTVRDARTIEFTTPPSYDDTVGFLLTPAVS